MEYLRLKDVCDINMGQSPTSDSYNDDGDGVPFFQGNADFGDRYPVTRKWCNAPTKMAQSGDILISVRAPIGAINYAKEECCIGRGLAAVTPDRDKVSPDFVFWFLKGKKEELNSKGTGSTFKAISRKVLEEILVPNVDLKEQSKYAEILEKIYFVQKLQKQELKYLDDLIKARFVEMFGNPVLNDKRWEQKSLGDITTKIGSGATPKGGKETYQEKGITLIRSMNVHNGKFEYKDLAHISDEQGAKLDNVMIEENDVLLNITGASVARSCVVPNNILPARVNQHVCIIRCKKCIIPEFLNNLLIDDNYQELLWNIAGSGATREAITKQQVENLNIILPSIELQNEFIVFCKQIDKSKSAKAMKEFNCHIIYYMLHFIQNDFNKNNLNEK